MPKAEKRFLSAEEIFAIDDRIYEEVYLDLWKGSVFVRSLIGRERDDFEASCLTGKGRNRDVNMKNLRAKLLVRTVCNEQKQPLFTTENIDALGEKNAAVLDKLFGVSQRLSGLGQEEVDALTKNSESDLNGDSTSASP